MTIKNTVEKLLRDCPEARDSDRRLIANVWWAANSESFKVIDGKYYLEMQAFLQKLPSPESIRRIRAKFQQEGLYLPSKEVSEKRKRLSRLVKEEMISTEWNMILN